ncbi:hypothetical protein [Mesobacillus maritimus]|uniref:DUF3899 domain-containing protein n=1 Tax=Mesobacillus maritimus TaxID=1643336 RepID=A0ABS7K7B0_9BACI|nr:hypothetical protein [Mesobacillus maritimus]MBY0098164.1 hypothetical protein [Mesobacillus maritimus]
MKKVIVRTILSAIIISIIVWGASYIFSFSYSEWSFFIGLGLSVGIFFFNSSGGTLSKVTTHHASQSVWKIQKDNELTATVGAVLYGSVLFTIISLLAMIIIYF